MNGVCGLGHNNPVLKPEQVIKLSHENIIEFFFGETFALALNKDKQLYSWGYNTCGQLARGHVCGFEDYLKPALIEFFADEKVKQISCGKHRAIVLTEDSKVYAWGWNPKGEVGTASPKPFVSMPSQVTFPGDYEIIKVLCCIDTSFAITYSGEVFGWGDNRLGQLGCETPQTLSTPETICFPSDVFIIDVSCTDKCSYFIDSNDNLYFCGWFNEARVPPTIIKRNQEITCLQSISIGHNCLALGEKCVYELNENKVIETKYQTFEDYYCKELKLTFRTMRAEDIKFEVVQLLEKIGSGSYGKVMKANIDGKMFAIKKVKLDQMHKNIQDSNSELNIMKNLKTIYVVKLYNYWIHDEFLYFQIELCDTDLNEVIKKKEHSNLEPIVDYIFCCEIFKQLLKCVHYLHTQSPPIIHRDIKPKNILLKYYDNGGQILKLCDFGLAKIQEDSSQSKTSNVGSSKYRAREMSNSHYNEKVDIFSLGIVVREDLFRIPSKEKNTKELFNAKLEKLDKLTNLMLHGNPESRPYCKTILADINNWSFNTKEIAKFNLDEKLTSDPEFEFVKIFKHLRK